MPSANGTIEAISIKEMPSPDNYGNTHRASLKIGEDWFSYGSLKKAEINVKHNGGWAQLQKGMEVEFMFDQNGDFKNVKKASFSITDASGAQAPQQRAPQQATPQKSQGGSFVNPAEIGQCMNLAAEVLKFSGEDMLNPDKAVEAIQWYKRSRQLFTSLYDGVTTEEALPKKSPTKKAAPVEDVPFEVEYDDDIDF